MESPSEVMHCDSEVAEAASSEQGASSTPCKAEAAKQGASSTPREAVADSESESEAESAFPVVDDAVGVAEARLGDELGVGEGCRSWLGDELGVGDAEAIALKTGEAGAGEEITGSSESTADEEYIKLHNQNCL